MQFGLMIIGDEILHGSRQDKHFAFFKQLLESRGLQLAWVQYLPDNRALLTRQLQRSFADGGAVFITGGIGATPDDHTRQAAAAALGLPLQRHPEALSLIEERTLAMGETLTSPGHAQRAKMADFAAGVDLIPNPFNRIAGFAVQQHYFLPGFPQMAHPMAEWVLDTFYPQLFNLNPVVDKAFLLTGPLAYESALLDLMERIVADYPALRLFSLPSIGDDGQRRHLELGVEGETTRVDQALEEIRLEIERRGITWRWRE